MASRVTASSLDRSWLARSIKSTALKRVSPWTAAKRASDVDVPFEELAQLNRDVVRLRKHYYCLIFFMIPLLHDSIAPQDRCGQHLSSFHVHGALASRPYYLRI